MLRRVLGLTALALLLPFAGLAAQQGSADAPAVVEVTARDFAFEAPAEIPSGWITFRMENVGQQEHFVLLGRLPDGKTFADYEHHLADPFYRLWEEYAAGKLDKAGFKKANIEAAPAWAESLQILGGPGLVAPGRTARTTVKLPPGRYWMECYIKTPEGEWHSKLGMARSLTVTEEPSDGSPPEPDLELTDGDDAAIRRGTDARAADHGFTAAA